MKINDKDALGIRISAKAALTKNLKSLLDAKRLQGSVCDEILQVLTLYAVSFEW